MKKKVLILIVLVIIYIASIFIRMNPNCCDFLYLHVNGYIYKYLNIFSQYFYISLYEIAIVFFVILGIVLFIKFLKNLIKHHLRKALNIFLKTLIIILSCIDIYTYLGSINYKRSQVPITTYEGEVSQELIDDSFNYFLNDYNNLSSKMTFNENHCVVSPYSLNELNSLINKEFAKLGDYYFHFDAKVKYLFASSIFSECHITGVTCCFTGEMLLNKEISDGELVHTLAHESSHAHGVYKENEANLLASYLLINSNDDFLRYCGYFATFTSLLDIYYYTNRSAWIDNWSKVDSDTYRYYLAENEFWNSKNTIDKIGDKINDLYLKFNGNSNGTDDYVDTETKSDSGQVDANNNTIYTISEYSPYQKLLFQTYLDNNNN